MFMPKYTIKKGDSLSKIAKLFNTSVAELARINKIKNKNNIYAGSVLLVPTQKESKSSGLLEIAKKAAVEKTQPRKPVLESKNAPASMMSRKPVGRDPSTPSLLSRAKESIKESIKEPILPTNVRQLVYDIFGGDATLTEKDLKSAELSALKNAVISARSRGSGNVNYVDYGTEGGTYDDIGGSKVYGGKKEIPNATLLERINDPNYSMKTTIGQAKITQNDKGETVILDRYNFNNAVDGSFKSYIEEAKKTGTNLYGQARLLGKFFGSAPGEGSPVAINLGKIG